MEPCTPQKGKVGLVNLGSTCFVNAAVQCLHRIMGPGPSHAEHMQELLLHKRDQELAIDAFIELREQLRDSTSAAVDPTVFVWSLSQDLPHLPWWPVRGGQYEDPHDIEQMDLAEFLMAFLSLLRSGRGSSGQIEPQFQGFEQKLMRCGSCAQANSDYSPRGPPPLHSIASCL